MTSREARARKEIFAKVARYYGDFHRRPAFSPGKSFVGYGGRIYNEEEMVAVTDAALDFWLTSGRYCDEFEKELGKYLGVGYVSLVNSGSSANLLALMALTSPKLGVRRIRPGDEVITVAAGFPTTITPIIQSGAVPVFVDVGLPSYNISAGMLEKALSRRTKAVMLAHTLGNTFDVKAVKAFCRRHGLWLIEDNCDSLGSRYKLGGKWGRTGSFGDISTSSFYPPHHITMGEGGAVCTSSILLKRIVDSFRDWGRDCWCPLGSDDTCRSRFSRKYGDMPLGYDHKYVYSHFGYNFKATEMQAAIGVAQLRKLPDFVAARKRNWARLKKALLPLSDRLLLPEAEKNSDPSWFGFLITVKPGAGFTRDQLVRHLELSKVQTRMLFAGNMLKQPCFDEMRRLRKGYRVVGRLENTDRVMNDTLWIGVYPGMTPEMIDYMAKKVLEFAGR